jgi:capsular polysaccharide biosynthesis protein
MFWPTIGRILWARRLIVAIVALGSLAGGAIVAVSATPQYDGRARVALNITRPDPATGALLGKKSIDPYLQTQLSLIRDYQVIGPAIEAVGWLDNPDVIAAYNARPPGDRRPLAAWLAQTVVQSLHTSLVEDSDIIEIRYRGESPELAEMVAGAIRDAYIEANIQERRASAAADADKQAERVEQIRKQLAELQAQKRALEIETGIILGPGGSDMEGDRLLALSSPERVNAPADPPVLMGGGDRGGRLVELDLELARAQEALGPNHPRLLELKATRAALSTHKEAAERAANDVAGIVIARERAKQAALDAQKERVLSQRQDVLRVRLVQDQIDLKSKSLEAAMGRVAYMRQISASQESVLTPVGLVESDPTPAFPNLALILGGTGGIGLFAGIVIAMLVEVLNLRIRTALGLRVATGGLPVLGAVPALQAERPTARRRRRPRLVRAPVPA